MKTSTLLVSLSLLMVALSPIVLPFAVKAEVPGPPLSVTATASGTDIILEWNPGRWHKRAGYRDIAGDIRNYHHRPRSHDRKYVHRFQLRKVIHITIRWRSMPMVRDSKRDSLCHHSDNRAWGDR